MDSLRTRGVSRATSRMPSISLGELQYVTDVPIYVTYNALNVISFAASFLVSFLIGYMGYGRDIKGDYKAIHDGFPTLTTPVFWTYAMWFVIFATQLVFVVTQMLIPFRKLPVVKDGIQFYFFIIQCCHIGYVISYCFRSIIVATAFMAVSVGFLYIICLNIYSISSEYQSTPDDNTDIIMNMHAKRLDVSLEYIIFRLPFHLHLGWAIVTVLVNFGELAVYHNWSNQSVIAFLNLGVFWVVGTFSLFYPLYPNFIVPLVVAWAAMGIWCELTPALSTIVTQYPYSTILKIRAGAIVICIEHGVLTVLRFVYHISKNYNIENRRDKSQQLINRQSTISSF